MHKNAAFDSQKINYVMKLYKTSVFYDIQSATVAVLSYLLAVLYKPKYIFMSVLPLLSFYYRKDRVPTSFKGTFVQRTNDAKRFTP